MNIPWYDERMLAHLLQKLLDILFPLTATERKVESLSPEELSEKLTLTEYDSVTALFSYRDPLIRNMVWLLKYKKNRHAAQLFGMAVHSYLLEDISDVLLYEGDARYIVVPLPLSKKRERERGYNQMELVADELALLGGVTVRTDILTRVKHTVPQTSLKRKSARKENIKGVFGVRNEDSLRGTRIILLDDVLTTGSTLAEARRVLRRAGATDVTCLALAH